MQTTNWNGQNLSMHRRQFRSIARGHGVEGHSATHAASRAAQPLRRAPLRSVGCGFVRHFVPNLDSSRHGYSPVLARGTGQEVLKCHESVSADSTGCNQSKLLSMPAATCALDPYSNKDCGTLRPYKRCCGRHCSSHLAVYEPAAVYLLRVVPWASLAMGYSC
eukprot:6193671-Pleurochrysis_carterae.AAC.6